MQQYTLPNVQFFQHQEANLVKSSIYEPDCHSIESSAGFGLPITQGSPLFDQTFPSHLGRERIDDPFERSACPPKRNEETVVTLFRTIFLGDS